MLTYPLLTGTHFHPVHLQAQFGQPIPLVVMGAMSFLLAMLTLPLPETLHQELPETLRDGEEFVHGQNMCCCVKPPPTVLPLHPRTRTHSVL